MKHDSSTLIRAEDAEYNFAPADQFPYITLAEAASKLSITPQRLSRQLRILQVPVFRIGYLILLDDSGVARIKTSLAEKEIRPGTKKRKTENAQENQ